MNSKRRFEIVQYVNDHHIADFSELYNTFQVSPATMRRDLVALEKEGLIERFHGGARSLQRDDNTSIFPVIDHRINHSIEAKVQIAQYALHLIQDHSSLILDASTTCLQLAYAICETDLHLTIITNYFEVANVLLNSENIDILFIGGHVRKGYSSTSGVIAEDSLMSMNADIGFIGVDGITPEKGLSNNRLDIIEWKKLVIKNSLKSYVLADHTKFNTTAILPICPLSDITNIITDAELPKETVSSFGSNSSKILFAK